MVSLALLAMSAALEAQTKATADPSARHGAGPAIEVYESSDEGRQSLVGKAGLRFTPAPPNAASAQVTIRVDDTRTFQEIDGFGASLTDASAWLLANKLTETQRKRLLNQLFDPEKGIGLSILRQPMGSSDFSREDYSYDDMPRGQSDPELKHFSIARDQEYIIPMLRELLAVNSKIKIIASPWSAPGWMKTSGTLIGGSLSDNSLDPLARYFVRFIQAYQAAGIPIYAITPQNEPRNIPTDYPGMGMTAEQQKTLVGEYLGPAVRAAGLRTKILIFDHNWDMMDFPRAVLEGSAAAQFAAGTATHCYGGAPEAQSELHRSFPEKEIWLTECSGGDWQKGDLLVAQADLIINSMRNWSKSVVLWNLVLDQNHGPHLGGCTDCRAVVTVNHATTPARIEPTVDFTALAHVSKFVSPGAYRIASESAEESTLKHVAFRCADGTLVLLVLNTGESSVSFGIQHRQRSASYTLAGRRVATFVWASQKSDSFQRK